MTYAFTQQLLRRAHGELDSAHAASSPRDQFIHAHMAALRACAAVLAGAPPSAPPRRQRVRSAWVQLAEVGEEWLPWVEYYTVSAGTRAALESGQLASIDPAHAREAEESAARFVAAVESDLLDRETRFATFAEAS